MLDVFADAFEVDGSLRDLVVLATSLDDWQILFDELRTKNYDLTFVCGNSHALPQGVDELLLPRRLDDPCPSLSLRLGANTLNCHFYQPDEIEFDIDPRDVTSEDNFLEITDFMRTIGKRLKKDVILAEENQHDLVLIRYRHELDDVVPGSWLNMRQRYQKATPEEFANFLKKHRNRLRPKE
jgi:hypothetical protein